MLSKLNKLSSNKMLLVTKCFLAAFLLTCMLVSPGYTAKFSDQLDHSVVNEVRDVLTGPVAKIFGGLLIVGAAVALGFGWNIKIVPYVFIAGVLILNLGSFMDFFGAGN